MSAAMMTLAGDTDPPTPVDIEGLVHWALAQTGNIFWRRATDRDLMFDHGYDALPKGCAHAYTGTEVAVARPRAMSRDARKVIDAIMALEPGVAAMVIACGREMKRPDWCEGIEPRQVPETVSWRKAKGWQKKGKKRGHRPVTAMVWKPCSPEAICAARDAYGRWHAALCSLSVALNGSLIDWSVTGFRAPAAPWNKI